MAQDNHSFNRIFCLYSLLPSHNAAPKLTSQLCELLKKNGYDVSKRTVERDLRKIEQVAEIDLERTPDGNLWRHATNKPIASSMMEPAEALTIMITQGLIKKILPSSSQKYLAATVKKAENTLDKSNQFSRWKDKLFVLSGETSSSALTYDISLNETVYNAVLKGLQIKLVYQPYENDKPKEYILNPLAIIVRDHYIYLAATKAEEPDSFRLFSFYRMKSVELIYSEIEKVDHDLFEQFIEKDYTRGLFPGGLESIELKVRNYSYEWLTFNKLHPDQVISEVDEEGWSHVKFEDYVSYELAGWILKQSVDVVVESPAVLKDFVIERLQESLAHYS